MHACVLVILRKWIYLLLHANTHTHTYIQILLQSLVVMCTWQSQDACALSIHCEPCKQSSWSRARNSQENRPFLTASGVGTQVPPGPLLFHEKRPWICTPANAWSPITAGWLVGGRGKSDGKIAWVGLELGDLRPRAKDTTTPPHTYIHLSDVGLSSTRDLTWIQTCWGSRAYDGVLMSTLTRM